jgi:2'-5' RNA ligase
MTIKVFPIGEKFALYELKEDGSKGSRVKGSTYDAAAEAEKHLAANERNLEKAIPLPQRAMVALFLPDGAAQSLYDLVAPLLIEAGILPVPASEYHITLVNVNLDNPLAVASDEALPLGTLGTVSQRDALRSLAQSFAGSYYFYATEGRTSGLIRFNSDNDTGIDALCVSFDSPGLWEMREKLLAAMRESLNLGWGQDHGFTPHITIAYLPDTMRTPDIRVPSRNIAFDAITVAIDDMRHPYSIGANFQKSAGGLVKAVSFNEVGDLVIPVVGIPFGGPVVGSDGQGRDLNLDFFDSETDLGDEADEVDCYFDHQKDENWMPDELISKGINFGRELVGKAKFDTVTNEGRLYNIIVDRRHRYLRLLHRLASEGYIDSSSVAKSRENDEKVPGRIKSWKMKGLDLTPAPMNPNARTLLKSLLLEEDVSVGKENSTTPAEPVVEDNGKGTNPEGQHEEPSKTPLTDQVKSIFEQAEAAAATPKQSPTEKSVELQLLEKIYAEQQALNGRMDSFDGQLTDVKTAFPVLADQVAKAITGQIDDAVGKSKAEKGAEELVRQTLQKSVNPAGVKPSNGKLPAHAPGKSR